MENIEPHKTTVHAVILIFVVAYALLLREIIKAVDFAVKMIALKLVRQWPTPYPLMHKHSSEDLIALCFLSEGPFFGGIIGVREAAASAAFATAATTARREALSVASCEGQTQTLNEDSASRKVPLRDCPEV